MVGYVYRNGESIMGSTDSGKGFQSHGEYQHNISSSGDAGMPTETKKTGNKTAQTQRVSEYSLYICHSGKFVQQ